MAPRNQAKKMVLLEVSTLSSTLKLKISDAKKIQGEHGDMTCTFLDDVIYEYDHCGEPKSCSECKTLNDNNARFCKHCAYPQANYEHVDVKKLYWSDVENMPKNSFENVVVKKIVPVSTGRAFLVMTYVDEDTDVVRKVVGAAIVDGKYEECDVTFTSKANKRIHYNVELLSTTRQND